MHSSSSLSDSESLTGSEMETAGQRRRQTAGKCLFCAQHTQSHLPVSESCRRDCQRSLMSPEAGRAARSHGFCCGPARACVGRSGRPPVAHGQGLHYWLQLASAGRSFVVRLELPSQLSPLQWEPDVPAGRPPAVGAPFRRAGSTVRSRLRREACCCTPGPAPADGRATWASASEARSRLCMERLNRSHWAFP